LNGEIGACEIFLFPEDIKNLKMGIEGFIYYN
jgi:hypothetical protein